MGAVFRKHPKQGQPAPRAQVHTEHPAQGFDPRHLQTPLLVWCRADAGVDLNGSTISKWRDMSGRGRDFSQATAGKQPALNSSGQGGRAEIVFDGADSMTGSSLYPMLSNASEWTLVMVLGQGWSDAGASGAYQNSPGIITASDVAGFFGAGIVDSNGPGGGIYNAGYKESASDASAISSAGDPCVFVLYSDSGIKSRLNGTDGTTGAAAAMLSSATTLEIGDSADGHSNEPYDGPMSELMIFDGVLSAGDLAIVEDYLGDRYSVRMAEPAAPGAADAFVTKCQDSSDLYALWTCQDQATGDLSDADTAMTDQTGGSVPDISVHLATAGNWQIEDSSPPDSSLDSLSKYVSTDASDLDTSNFASVDSAISPIASETDSSSGFTVLYLPSEYLSGNSKLEIVCYDGSGSTPTAAAGAFFLGAYSSNFPSTVFYLHGGRMASDTGFNHATSGNSGTDSWRSGAWCFFGWRLVSDGAGGFTAYCYVQQLGSAWGTDQTSWSQAQTSFSTLKDGLRFGYNSTSLAGSAGTAWAAHALFSDDIGVGATGVTLRTIFEEIS